MIELKKNKGMCLLLFLFCLVLFVSSSTQLETKVDSLDNFRKIIIIEEGRKKPLDTFAQNILKKLSGKSNFMNKPAIYWLSKVLLSPEKTVNDNIFLVNNPEVLNSIGIRPTGVRERYSFVQLKNSISRLRNLAISASKIKGKSRTKVQNELILLFNKLVVFQQLADGFHFLVPHNDFAITDNELKKFLELPEDMEVFSFFDLIKRQKLIKKVRSEAKAKKNGDRTSIEKGVLELSDKIKEWFSFYQGSPLTIIPVISENEEKWISPWDSLHLSYMGDSPVKKEMVLICDFINAYFRGNQKQFDTTIDLFNRIILNRIKGDPSEQRISLEVFYNNIDPFYKSKFLYGFSIVLLLLSFLFFRKLCYRLSFILLITGGLFHTFGIIARMIITGRPPVTNLYETFVFTGWVTVLLGFVLEFLKKKNTGIFTGSIAGLLMLFIAGKYSLEGDTMGMLVAVLDSNFWLSTHVITVTVGYGGIVISGIIGHVFILQGIFIPGKKDVLKSTFQAIYSTQAFGLVFTFIGTVLGGIWADQSWGRFWGWDPKENGALLIILWSAILFHARLANMIREKGFAYGSVIGVIAVAMAWFGVNLLGVGLHSYGFTSGIAMSLFVFLVIELVFIFTTAILYKRA